MFSIVDLLGKVIIDNAVYSGLIDISNLDNGIYFVRLNDEKNTTTLKFIKVK
jgi:hypothetical protein